jgi:hypothetical protein
MTQSKSQNKSLETVLKETEVDELPDKFIIKMSNGLRTNEQNENINKKSEKSLKEKTKKIWK